MSCSRTVRLAALVAIGYATVLSVGRAEEVVTDIVFLMDVSGSMRELQVGEGKTITFEQLMERLQKFADSGLPDNSNVTVITFGEDAKQHEPIHVETPESRKLFSDTLAGLAADARATYMSKGVSLALEELARLKQEFPSHHRLLFLITDGKNNPPQGVADPISFEKLRTDVRDRLNLKPGDDFYLWYAHFGQSDQEVQDLTGDWKGESKPFDEPTWKIGRFNFNRRVIRLAEQLPGQWTTQFPSEEDLEHEEFLTVEAYNADGKELGLGPVAIPNLPPDAKIEVDPPVMTLRDGKQNVVLKLNGTNVPPGEYEGRLELKPPAGFVIPSPGAFYLTLKVIQPVVSVGPARKLDLGAVSPSASGQAELVLKPDAAAAALKPKVQAVAELDSPPEGLAVTAQPSSLALDQQQTLRVTASLADDSTATPGPVTGTLRLTSDNPYVKLEPAELPLSLEVGRVVIPLDRSEFLVEPDEKGEFQLTLPIKADALPADASVSFALGAPKSPPDEAAEAPALELKPAGTVFSREQPAVEITGTLAESTPGKWTYEVSIESQDPLRAFQPATIRVIASVAMPEVVVAPPSPAKLKLDRMTTDKEKIDIGLAPNRAAAAATLEAKIIKPADFPEGVEINVPQRIALAEHKVLSVEVEVAADAKLPGKIRLYEVQVQLSGGPHVKVDPSEVTLQLEFYPTAILVAPPEPRGVQYLEGEGWQEIDLPISIDTQEDLAKTPVQLVVSAKTDEGLLQTEVEPAAVMVAAGDKQMNFKVRVMNPGEKIVHLSLNLAAEGATVRPAEFSMDVPFEERPWSLLAKLLLFGSIGLVVIVIGEEVVRRSPPMPVGELQFVEAPSGQPRQTLPLRRYAAFWGRNKVTVGSTPKAAIKLVAGSGEPILFELTTMGKGKDLRVNFRSLGAAEVKVDDRQTRSAQLKNNSTIQVKEYKMRFRCPQLRR